MTTTSPVQTATTAWSSDILGGAAWIIIQRKTNQTLLVHIGPSAPAADSLAGLHQSVGDDPIEIASPVIAPGDKVYVRSLSGECSYVTVKP